MSKINQEQLKIFFKVCKEYDTTIREIVNECYPGWEYAGAEVDDEDLLLVELSKPKSDICSWKESCYFSLSVEELSNSKQWIKNFKQREFEKAKESQIEQEEREKNEFLRLKAKYEGDKGV